MTNGFSTKEEYLKSFEFTKTTPVKERKPIFEMLWEDEQAGRIPAKDYVSWKVYQSLISPAQAMEAENVDIAIDMINQSWKTHKSDSAWDKEWRGHYEDIMAAFREIKDKKIENYPERRVQGLMNQLYWDIKADNEEAEKYEKQGNRKMAGYYS